MEVNGVRYQRNLLEGRRIPLKIDFILLYEKSFLIKKNKMRALNLQALSWCIERKKK